MATDEMVKNSWTEHWSNKTSLEESASIVGKFLRKQRFQILFKMLKNFNRNLSVIDIGCGGGLTLKFFRDTGFTNSIGIDFIQHSIDHCSNLGFTKEKDIFLMDAKRTSFQNDNFDIVFSEGLWEHFTDPRPYMAEAVRIGKKYIIVIQPNHFSLFGWFMHAGWNLLSRDKGGVLEYSFPLSYFRNFLKSYNFKLVKSKSTIFNEQAIMIFEKSTEHFGGEKNI